MLSKGQLIEIIMCHLAIVIIFIFWSLSGFVEVQ